MSTTQLAKIQSEDINSNYGKDWKKAVISGQGAVIINYNYLPYNHPVKYTMGSTQFDVYQLNNILGELTGFMYPTSWGMVMINLEASHRKVVLPNDPWIPAPPEMLRDAIFSVLDDYLTTYPTSATFNEWSTLLMYKPNNTPRYNDAFPNTWLRYLPEDQKLQIQDNTVPTLKSNKK